MRVTSRTTKSAVSFAVGWKRSFVTSCPVQSLQNCPRDTIFSSQSCCFQDAQWLLVLAGWSCRPPGKEEASGYGRDAPSNVLDAKWECLKGAAPTHHTTVVHNMHQIGWWRDSNVSCQGQTFPEAPNYHQPTRYFHKLLRRAYCKGSVMRQLVTLNSGYLKNTRGGRVSRGHFGLRRRWKIITTSSFYTLFQGTNT